MTDAIGYKQPPKRTQFKPGQSGNPNGRPKGARNFKFDFNDELAELVADPKTNAPVSRQRLIIRKIVAAAIAGDAHATSAIFTFWQRFASETDDDETPSEQDSDIMTDFAARRRRAVKTSTREKE